MLDQIDEAGGRNADPSYEAMRKTAGRQEFSQSSGRMAPVKPSPAPHVFKMQDLYESLEPGRRLSSITSDHGADVSSRQPDYEGQYRKKAVADNAGGKVMPMHTRTGRRSSAGMSLPESDQALQALKDLSGRVAEMQRDQMEMRGMLSRGQATPSHQVPSSGEPLGCRSAPLMTSGGSLPALNRDVTGNPLVAVGGLGSVGSNGGGSSFDKAQEIQVREKNLWSVLPEEFGPHI